MIAAYTISIPHIVLLSIYLSLLIYTLAKDYTLAFYTVIGLVCLECFWNLSFGTGNISRHTTIDLLAIFGISAIYFLIRNTWLKWFLLITSYLIFVGFHISKPKENKSSIQSKSTELFIQFKDVELLNNWLVNEGQSYNYTYPLFQPQDRSFLLDEYLLIKIDENELDAFYRSHLGKDGIEHIEVNDKVMAYKNVKSDLNDPHVDKQWMTDNFELGELHRLVQKEVVKAQASPSIIAILDTGVDAQHEDLKDNYISISSRYDSDSKGHGTHCAGIAAAVTGNKIGITSLLPPRSPVKVTSVKVLSNFGAGTQKTIIDGIIKAADEGCSVISMSLGGITSDSKEKAYREAVKYAQSKGSIVVVAAGNSGKDARSYTPANVDGVITVTALDSLMNRASFGNDVSQLRMGLAAPGKGIFSTFPNNEYKAFNGTSMAAPFISGLVGLMKAYDSSLTTEEVYAIIADTATKKDGQIIADPLAAMKQLISNRQSALQ